MAQSRLGGIGGRSALKLATPRASNFKDTRADIPRARLRGGGGGGGGGGGQGQVSEPRSNLEANAELAAMDAVNADRQMNREALKQAEMQTDMMQQDKTTQLAQAARGESPEAQAGQQRGIDMRRQRDDEKEKQRFKSTAELMGGLGQREPDKMGNINFEQQDMALLNDMIPDLNVGDYMDRKTGKMLPMFARTEPSGEPGSQEQVLAFYAMPPKGEEGMPTPLMGADGSPVRVNTKAARQLANIWKLDQDERTGFPGTQRKAAQEEANIRGTEAKAIKDVGEGQYAAMGKPKEGAKFTEKDRRKAITDNRKEYTGMLATLREYSAAGDQPPPAFIGALKDLEDEMAELKGMGIPAGGGQAAPAAPQQQRQRATNPKTGEVIEWDGQAWVPVS